jgi:6-phosphogluconolactonase (cycloisomerase 2 family)
MALILVRSASVAFGALLMLGLVCCGTTTGTSPTPGASPTPVSPGKPFLAVSLLCSGQDRTRLGPSSVHAIDAATGALLDTHFAQESAASAGLVAFGPTTAAGRFLYATRRDPRDANATSLQSFRVDDAGTTHLVGEAANPSRIGGNAIAIDAAGRWLYLALLGPQDLSQGTGPNMPTEIAVFALSPQTGAAEPKGAPVMVPLPNIMALKVAPSGTRVYAISIDGHLAAYDVNTDTGALTAVPGSPFAIPAGFALAVHPSGRFLYTESPQGVHLNQVLDSGAVVPVAVFAPPPTQTTWRASDFTIDPSGRFLYAAAFFLDGGLVAYRIDAAGRLTLVAGSPFATDRLTTTVAVDRSGQFLYAAADPYPADASGSGVWGFRIDQATGALTPLAGFPFVASKGNCPFGVAATP